MTREQYERRARLWHRLADSLGCRCANALNMGHRDAAQILAHRYYGARERADECWFMATSEFVHECPGEDCPHCSGDACMHCGDGRGGCQHDVLDRHGDKRPGCYV